MYFPVELGRTTETCRCRGKEIDLESTGQCQCRYSQVDLHKGSEAATQAP